MTLDDLPQPMVPAEADLRDFPYTPVYRARLLGSTFNSLIDDGVWRAGVTLWLMSWDQSPAGTLPNDDVELCKLAGLGREIRKWKRLREGGALRNWVLSSDGRLHHPVVAEGVNAALREKDAQRARTYAARIAGLRRKVEQSPEGPVKAHAQAELQALIDHPPTLVADRVADRVARSVTGHVTESKRSKGKGSKGKGLGKEGASPLVGLLPDDGPTDDAPPKVNGHAHTPQGEARAILEFLNGKAGKRFPPSDTNVGIIVARMREGFTPTQVRQVIALKVRAWVADEKMREFLRPATLFAKSNFSNYVGELVPVDDPPDDDPPGELTRERDPES